jgi:branched-chain amino acid transport system ATP-binding protein
LLSATLQVQKLTKSFGALEALGGVDFRVADRRLVLIIGPNGSGKTTLINTISGLLKPDSGTVRFNDIEIQGWPAHRVYGIGLVRTFQIPLPFVKLTVLENLLTAYRLNPGESFLRAPFRKTWENVEEMVTRAAFDILRRLKLDHLWDQRSGNLSGGQFKLLEIGRALISGAMMIMMDEPVAGVNPVLAHEVFTQIRSLRNELGVSFLLVEHRLDIALQYVDYIYAMDKGMIISEGEPRKVVNDQKVIEAYLGG